MKPKIAKQLLDWYALNQRSFPWRDAAEPYAVWVSEIMAQQTRLETMLPYYHRWMERFPTVESLATASQQEVLSLWEGLGYYGRARNLHKAAKLVAKDFSGKLPASSAELVKLPGIGRYTAGAISSIAFGADEPVVDGNVKRVLARVLAIAEAVNTTAGEKQIWKAAEDHLPKGRAANYNQALMEFGALVCTTRNPQCEQCPLRVDCQAYLTGRQLDFPVRVSREKSPHYTVTAAVIRENDKVMIAQRAEDALLGGMWEFPGGKQEIGESLENCLKREINEELGVKIKVGKQLGIFKHAYTHFKVTLHAFDSQLVKGDLSLNVHQAVEWVSADSLSEFPMGKIDRQISLMLTARGNQDEA